MGGEMEPAKDNELSKLERELQKERALRDARPEASDEELEPSYARSDAIEDKLLATEAHGPVGFLVKLREIRYQLQAQGVAWRWIDSLERDLAAAAVEPERPAPCAIPF